MSKAKPVTLEDAVVAAQKLPSETQEAITSELMEKVEDFSTPKRSPTRQALIKERLGKPLRPISCDDLTAMLRKYKPGV